MVATELCNQNCSITDYLTVIMEALTLGYQKIGGRPAPTEFAPDWKALDYYHAGLTTSQAVSIEWQQFMKGQRNR